MYGNAFDQDRMGIFVEYETLLFSPLRRCQSTAAQVFGLAHDHQAAGQPDLKVQNFPWAHEELKSESDLGKDTADLMDFTVKVRDAHIALGGWRGMHPVPPPRHLSAPAQYAANPAHLAAVGPWLSIRDDEDTDLGTSSFATKM